MTVLPSVEELYRTRRDEVTTNIDALVKAVSKTEQLKAADEPPGLEQLNGALQGLAGAFDREWGGFGKAPKFPTTYNLELVLRAYMTNRSEVAKEIIDTTLDAMASGGIYDHIGGGFCRYSTDREWLVPHFEKMLYDQALVMRLYTHAFAVFGKMSWRLVIEEIANYVLGILRHPDGAFCSSEDADSLDAEGVSREGAFYTWTPDEVQAALAAVDERLADPRAGAVMSQWFGITPDGNFEGRSIPNRQHDRGELMRPAALEAARRVLLQERLKRPRPGLDDKVLTEWNALMITTLAEAGALLVRPAWIEAAVEAAEFLLTELRDENGRWFRSWHRDGAPQARHMALAADHAALVDAFIELSQATGQARWIEEAVRTADTLLDWFWDPVEGGLYTTAEDAPALIVRQKDVMDNSTASANSTAAGALFRLAVLTGEQRYANMAERILLLLTQQISDRPGGFGHLLTVVDTHRRESVELVITGDRPDLVRSAQTIWRPDRVLAWGEPYDSPLWEHREDGLAYLCRDYTCAAPISEVDDLVAALTGKPVATSDADE